ncbi:MAG: TonB-dependent receptor [Bacteroidota bacterium]
MKKLYFIVLSILLFSVGLMAQKGGTVRGSVYDSDSGEPIIFGTVQLGGTTIGANTDENGFFSIGGVPPGDYNLIATYIGYDSVSVAITVREGRIVSQNLMMNENAVQLGTVELSARREKARTEIQISKVTVSANQIKALPSAGGQTDLAQFLPVLPGIISTGDQGGQIYIRGGSPVQNRIMIDGMTIYNPFHSIGFFSVFETETIKTVDVLTAGFNAEYGGRVSAVIDIKTREGNKKRLAGLVSANPFQAKAVIEGPLKKFEGSGGSSSFLFTAKHSYINETSPFLYSYAVDTALYVLSDDPDISDRDKERLPFQFTDFYGKLSFLTGNGSNFNVFGFNFNDRVNYIGVSTLDWNTFGGGSNFTLIPPNSNLVIGGTVAYSKYDIEQTEAGGDPRTSSIASYNVALDFTYFGLKNEIKYGFDIAGLDTDFSFKNFLGNTIEQTSNTPEVAGYIKFKQQLGNWIFEPSLRLQLYPSQDATNIEPRFGIKYNATDWLRFKFAGGRYSQNLISSVNEQDVVNLFVGFLTGPEEQVFNPDGSVADHRLQKANHGVAGVEIDINKYLEVNLEGYYKEYTQLIQVNRNKLDPQDPDFVTETGDAYGGDLSLRYENKNVFAWATYSLAYVKRDDGQQVYPTIFDRRHNVNLLATYKFGKRWEAAARWNFGSGLPFSLSQGFFNEINFNDGLATDPLTENPDDIGIILDERRNRGRLPSYHRLDLSLKKTYSISKYSELELVASATNAYDRANIFYFDRIRNSRVDQLPIMPSIGLTFTF